MDDKRVCITVQLAIVWITTVLCGVHPDGVSDIYRSQDALGNYQFGYSVTDGEGEHFRREGTDARGAVIGSYGLTDADGRHRVVDYIADENGFRAHVRTNEPGTTDSSPAAVTVSKGSSSNSPVGHLDSAATSLSPSSNRAPARILDHVAYGTRLTPVSSIIPLHAKSIDHSPGGVATDTPPVPKSPSYNDGDPVAYYPPIRAFSPLRPPLHEESASDNYPQTDSARVQPPGQSYQPAPPRPGSASRPYTPPYGGSSEYPNVYRGYYPAGEGDRNPLGPNFQDDFGNPVYPNGYSPTSHRDGVARIPNRGPQERFPITGRGHPAITTINGISIPIPNPDNPNLVLQAVPIPNGIQAVHVDSSTGQVYRNLNYPIYNRQGIDNEGRFKINRDRSNYFPNYDNQNYGPDGFGGYGNSPPRIAGYPNFRNPQSSYPDGGQSSFPGAGRGGYGINRLPTGEPNFSTTTDRDIAVMSRYFPQFNYGSQGNSDGLNFSQNDNPNGFQRDYLFGPRYPLFYDSVDSDRYGFGNYGPSFTKSGAFDPYPPPPPPPPDMNVRRQYQYPMYGGLQQNRGYLRKRSSNQKSAAEHETTTTSP